ncbi:hypothetical protein ACQJBY_030913 [Aegilops geniculata]
MASGNDGQSGQHLPRQPPASTAPSWTFSVYLERLKEERRHNLQPSSVMDPALLTRARCGHCSEMEDLVPERAARPESEIHGGIAGNPPPPVAEDVTVELERDVVGEGASSAVSLLDQIAFEGDSCLKCATMVYKKTRHLLYEPAAAGSDGDTPLHCAARSSNLRMLCHLILLVGEEYGHRSAAHVLRKPNGRGETALHEAVRLGNMAIAERLMWVDPELAQYPAAGQGTSPLYLAVSLGDEKIARMLYHRASDNNLSYSGPDGQNALHAAVLHGTDMTKLLIEWNSELSKGKDQNGSTPLHFVVSVEQAAFRIHWLRFRIIWSSEAPSKEVLEANLSAAYQSDKQGMCPVHVAAVTDREVAVRILHKNCPGCTGFRDNQGRSFLHLAVQNKSFHVVRYACRESSFTPIMNARDNDGNTAIHLAVEVEDLPIFCSLLRNPKVLLNLRNNKDQTPLDLARSKKRTDFSYGMNPENVIYRTLVFAHARHGSFRRDRLQQRCTTVPVPEPENEEKKESDKVTDSTRTLSICSVLIASMTFGATFAAARAVRITDHTKGGAETLDAPYFKAFMIANSLAFISSSLATIGLLHSGTPMVKLPIRQRSFEISLGLTITSLIFWDIAFTLGIYMVLDPVSRKSAIAVVAMIPVLAMFPVIKEFLNLGVAIKSLWARRR